MNLPVYLDVNVQDRSLVKKEILIMGLLVGRDCPDCKGRAVTFRKKLFTTFSKYTCKNCGVSLKVSLRAQLLLTGLGLALANILEATGLMGEYYGLLLALLVTITAYTFFLPLSVDDEGDDGISRGL